MKMFRLTVRSEEHTSELQSQSNLVCRLLLEKKKDDVVLLNVNELRADPQVVAFADVAARAERVDVQVGGHGLLVNRLVAELVHVGRGADDDRADVAELRDDGVGEREAEEVCLGVGLEVAERQYGERARPGGGAVACGPVGLKHGG